MIKVTDAEVAGGYFTADFTKSGFSIPLIIDVKQFNSAKCLSIDVKKLVENGTVTIPVDALMRFHHATMQTFTAKRCSSRTTKFELLTDCVASDIIASNDLMPLAQKFKMFEGLADTQKK